MLAAFARLRVSFTCPPWNGDPDFLVYKGIGALQLGACEQAGGLPAAGDLKLSSRSAQPLVYRVCGYAKLACRGFGIVPLREKSQDSFLAIA